MMRVSCRRWAVADQKYTYGDLYRQGVLVLNEDEDARLDARLLLEEVCGTDLQTLLVYPETPVSQEQAARYMELLKRRAEHEPTAYILGKTEFMGLPFIVTGDVLIPEQDSEILVETALSAFRGGLVLDLCTGSGCLVLSLLKLYNESNHGKTFRSVRAVAGDLSDKALAVARRNAAALSLSDAVSFRQGDLFDVVQEEEEGGFDLLISNPPYIRTDVIGTLREEVACREPYMALDGGADGLSFYRRIAAGAGTVLKNHGRLIVEIGYDQGEAVRELFTAAGFDSVCVLQDYGHRDRVVIGEKNV